MLENLSEQILDCLRRAEESAERARHEPDSAVRRDFLDMERRWLKLAHSYEFLEQLGLFTSYNNQRRVELSRRLARLNQLLGNSPVEKMENTVETDKRQIIDQRARIEQQKDTVAQLERQGRDVQALKAARGRLAMMVQTLARMEAEYATTHDPPGSRNLR
jgi:hypothetical protein